MRQTRNDILKNIFTFTRACARVGLRVCISMGQGYSNGLITKFWRISSCVLLVSATLVFAGSPKTQKKILTKEEIVAKRQSEKKGLARHRLNQELASSGMSEGGLALISSLRSDPDPAVRQGAAQALGNYSQNPKIVRALSDALETETVPAVRYACALSISVSKSFLTMRALEKLANDADPKMRRQVAAGLKRQNNVRSEQLLKKLRNDSDESVRKMARTR